MDEGISEKRSMERGRGRQGGGEYSPATERDGGDLNAVHVAGCPALQGRDCGGIGSCVDWGFHCPRAPRLRILDFIESITAALEPVDTASEKRPRHWRGRGTEEGEQSVFPFAGHLTKETGLRANPYCWPAEYSGVKCRLYRSTECSMGEKF